MYLCVALAAKSLATRLRFFSHSSASASHFLYSIVVAVVVVHDRMCASSRGKYGAFDPSDCGWFIPYSRSMLSRTYSFSGPGKKDQKFWFSSHTIICHKSQTATPSDVHLKSVRFLYLCATLLSLSRSSAAFRSTSNSFVQCYDTKKYNVFVCAAVYLFVFSTLRAMLWCACKCVCVSHILSSR